MSKILELRKKLNITQAEFGALFEIPVRTIQNWETGQRSCPAYVVNLIEFKINTLFLKEK